MEKSGDTQNDQGIVAFDGKDVVEITILGRKEYELCKESIPRTAAFWLKTPSAYADPKISPHYKDAVMFVDHNGVVNEKGANVDLYNFGVRPVLMLDPDASKGSSGSSVAGLGCTWTVCGNMAVCDRIIWTRQFCIRFDSKNANDFENSALQRDLKMWMSSEKLKNGMTFQIAPSERGSVRPMEEQSPKPIDELLSKGVYENGCFIRRIRLISVSEYLECKDRIPKIEQEYWWTQTPCEYQKDRLHYVSSIRFYGDPKGDVSSRGHVWEFKAAVRPILILSKAAVKIGDVIKLFGYRWTVIREQEDGTRMVICNEVIGHLPFSRDKSAERPNDYETSYIKEWLGQWLVERYLINRIEGIRLLRLEEFKEFAGEIPPLPEPTFWRLETPGVREGVMAVQDRYLDRWGYRTDFREDVRPVLTLKQSMNFSTGDKISLFGFDWTALRMENDDCLLLSDTPIIDTQLRFRKDYYSSNATHYDQSDIKFWLEKWLDTTKEIWLLKEDIRIESIVGQTQSEERKTERIKIGADLYYEEERKIISNGTGKLQSALCPGIISAAEEAAGKMKSLGIKMTRKYGRSQTQYSIYVDELLKAHRNKRESALNQEYFMREYGMDASATRKDLINKLIKAGYDEKSVNECFIGKDKKHRLHGLVSTPEEHDRSDR